MIPKLMKRDLRKLGACSGGRNLFGTHFPRGAELTYENMLEVCDNIPTSYVYWFLRNIANKKTAERYDNMVFRCIERIDVHGSNWNKENKRIARWLFNTLTKHFAEGGDLSLKEYEI